MLLPLEINEHVVYGCAGVHHRHGPGRYIPYLFPPASRSIIPGGDKISIKGKVKGEGMLKQEQRDAVRRVRVFAQQYWLEDFNGRRGGWADFCSSWAPLQQQSSRGQRKSSSRRGKDSGRNSSVDEIPSREEARKGGLEELNVTIRHRDWWHYLLGPHSPMVLDPFKAGRPTERASPYLHGSPADADASNSAISSPQSSNSILSSPSLGPLPSTSAANPQGKPSHLTGWATHLRHFTHLRTFELELETLDEPDKRSQLDEIVSVAPSWRFPLGNDKNNNQQILVFDSEATTRSFWSLDPPKSANSWGLLDPDLADEASLSRASDIKKLRRRRKAVREQERSSRPDGTRAAGSRSGSGAGWEAGNEAVRYYVVLLVWRAQKVEQIKQAESSIGSTSTEDIERGKGQGIEHTRTGSQADGGALSATPTRPMASRTASTTTGSITGSTTAIPAHPAAATGTARAVGRDVIPSYWG